MKQIMSKIFGDHGFRELPVSFLEHRDDFFAVNTDEENINYFLVLFQDYQVEPNFLLEKVPWLYSKIKGLEHGYDERMDKNVSLILCLKHRDESSDKERSKQIDEVRKQIFEIEEDPYYFKKYVLTYTESQVESLVQILTEGLELTGKVLNRIINSPEEFLVFKRNPSHPSVYNLCTKLFIKLPFLVLKQEERILSDLSGVIKTRLGHEGLEALTEKLLSLDFEGIDNIDLDKILAIMGGETK